MEHAAAVHRKAGENHRTLCREQRAGQRIKIRGGQPPGKAPARLVPAQKRPELFVKIHKIPPEGGPFQQKKTH
ncbi:hypothetical protein SDC9_169813 [bioreactor metagenome]|uniref:Uncharacterized protein n=1 Tax=bioreactor metagenome TaxID=1076179 RepID=A0A645G8U8_9ZZZZ